jgi:hypothetical protein
MRKFVLIIFVFLLIFNFISAQEDRPLIEVTSAVDTSRITIGDRVTYTITIDYVDTMRVEKPGEGVNLGQFEIKDYKIYDAVQENNRILQKYEYVISVFDTGTFVIPPFPVAYFPTDSMGDYRLMEASAITIYVESVIHDEERQLRDVKPPIDIPYNYLLLISVLVAILLLGVAVFLGYRLYKKRKEKGYLLKPPEPPIPAHEVALEALEDLLSKNLLADGLQKQFYSEISEIIRRYLEGRYYVPAFEETSSEIMHEMHKQELSEAVLKILREILDLSDLVKFAKYKPSTGENENIVTWSRQFIEETMVVFETEPEIGNKPEVTAAVAAINENEQLN